jgi:pimeloyl-ACP methyl ester carboxylesterase
VFTCVMSTTTPKNGSIAVSEEQFVTTSDGVELCFQTFGDPADEAALLIMGLGGPMTWWDPDFCTVLASKGFFVIRFDNRDTGKSSKIRHRIRRPDVVKAFLGRPVHAPYTLSTMGEDALAILDELGIARAHLCGVSMGGMIAQTLAAHHPDSVLSLTSIMSNTGNFWTGQPAPRLLPIFLSRPRGGREESVERVVKVFKTIGSRGLPQDLDAIRDMAERSYDRDHDPNGPGRQLAAIIASGDRTKELRTISAPTLVIHGTDDRLVGPTGGRATARAIPNAKILKIKGMGHDLPRAAWPQMLDAIAATAALAEPVRQAA